MLDFGLIVVVAWEAYRVGATSVEVEQHGHYNNKIQLWVIARRGAACPWTTWLYYGGK